MDFPSAENEKDEDPHASAEVSCDYCVLRKAYTHALTVGCTFLFPFIYKARGITEEPLVRGGHARIEF
jgi:hypothetical protein